VTSSFLVTVFTIGAAFALWLAVVNRCGG